MLYEGSLLEMGQRYASMMLIFLMSLTYVPFMFYLPWITLFGILYQYWLVKVMLVYVHKWPVMMGNSMAMFYLRTLPWILAIYSTSQFYWFHFLKYNGWYIFMIILIITLVLKIVLSWLIERCLPRFWHE